MKDLIEKKLNRNWDGKLFAYHENACEYVDVTNEVEE